MYKFLVIIVRPIVKLLFPYKFYGLENIPQNGGVIISSNHLSFIDPVFIALICKRKIHFMGKAELFKNKFVNWFFRKIGAFPVKRGTGDKHALSEAIDIINNGEVLGIFPEGTRSKTGKPGKPKKGISVIISHSNDVMVVPTSMYRKGKGLLFNKTIVRFGKPISKAELNISADNKHSLDVAAKTIMDKSIELWRMGL